MIKTLFKTSFTRATNLRRIHRLLLPIGLITILVGIKFKFIKSRKIIIRLILFITYQKNMALVANIRSIFKRITAADLRSKSIRLFSDQHDENADDQQTPIDPLKDRTKIIPVETSIRYLQSKAYKQTYGENPVWFLYRRNHKGGLPPKKTRRSCVRNGVISTGNPCPICRDEYLVLEPRNTKLLEQFISEYTGHILDAYKTGLCQKKHKELLVAIEKAWDHGFLTYDVPFREYDYSLYNKTTN